MNLNALDLLLRFDRDHTLIEGVPCIERRLGDLRGIFMDAASYEAALVHEDPIVYTVQTVEPASGDGDLHIGLGTLMPGRIGAEYYMTKGHLHSWRPAAEIYIGLSGEGGMLLESEDGSESRYLPLGRDTAVYVPGHTAHRTINTGSEPLRYLGIYPARAGHDYGAIAAKNFAMVVIEHDGAPAVIRRPFSS